MSGAGLAAAIAVMFAAAALRELPLQKLRGVIGRQVSLPSQLPGKVLGTMAGGAAAVLAAPAAPGRTALVVAFALPVAGFLAPDAWRQRQARLRHRRLLAALPDALDLLAVSVGAGRGAAAGLEQIARSGEGPLAEEMRLAVAEISCGVPLGAALASLRGRVPGGEMARLIAAIERSRRFGSPLADQLRRQATALRRDSHREVEDRAAKAAPKIQLVVALILVPSVLLMITAGLIANAGTLLAGF